jgi:putative oxidoreductase
MSNQQNLKLPFPEPLVSAIGAAKRLIQTLAQPWLVQLVLRLALAVPFWKSGILKWHGFLQLNDTAIDLFTQEFQLHLPGGPYPFAAKSHFRCCSCLALEPASPQPA